MGAVNKSQKRRDIMEEKELLGKLIDRIKKNNLEVDINKITEAFTLAAESHGGQKRRSGEDYILHPV